MYVGKQPEWITFYRTAWCCCALQPRTCAGALAVDGVCNTSTAEHPAGLLLFRHWGLTCNSLCAHVG